MAATTERSSWADMTAVLLSITIALIAGGTAYGLLQGRVADAEVRVGKVETRCDSTDKALTDIDTHLARILCKISPPDCLR